MVSITLSVPAELRKLMKRFPEINWSQFVRSCIETKTNELSWKEEMLAKIKNEDKAGFTQWTLKMGGKVNEGISRRLKKEGLL